jgi:antitoxin YefM
MAEAVSISTFRDRTGPLFTQAVFHHAPLLIRRGANDLGMLLGVHELEVLLADYSFNPQVRRGDGSGQIAIWLPELEIYGQADTYAEAREDLLGEVRVYIDEFIENAELYVHAPNRKGHLAYILRAFIADQNGQLEAVVFPGPPASARGANRGKAAAA